MALFKGLGAYSLRRAGVAPSRVGGVKGVGVNNDKTSTSVALWWGAAWGKLALIRATLLFRILLAIAALK